MIEIYQVDAFASKLFEGNPAAVIPLPEWPEDSLLQSIAAENNLAETAYLVKQHEHWELRWFTPTSEVALCGHATLAAGYVVFTHLDSSAESVSFNSRESGTLLVSRVSDGRLSMSFPVISVTQSCLMDEISSALGQRPASVWKGHYSEDEFDFMAVFGSAQEVAGLQPDVVKFSALSSRGIIATASGEDCDFVSRYFAPEFGIPEDPVTGSAHCLLAPYWATKLNKADLTAVQISARTGTLECRVFSDHVELIGCAIEYMRGVLSFTLPSTE